MKKTFGYELELGDIRRDRKVPSHLGEWEYAETDIVNLHAPYKNIAVDPQGKEPPMGGEINIKPGLTIEEVADRVSETIEWFRKQGDKPTASCVNHGHVHIRVIGLRDKPAKLRKMTDWIGNNQDYIIKKVYGYREAPTMKQTKTARTYLKWDGGRPMPEWMVNNIYERCKDFDDFIRLQCCGIDGVSRGRPFRYALNTYCMKHTDTIETRCLRASLEHRVIFDSLQFASDWIDAALLTGTSAEDLITNTGYEFPSFYYDHDSYLGWERTKWGKERGNKVRKLYDL